jgi:hypothetical protein
MSIDLYRRKAHSSHRLISPNRKPHLMATHSTGIHADVCIGLVYYTLSASDLHLFPTTTLRAFGAAGRQQSLKRRHALTHIISELRICAAQEQLLSNKKVPTTIDDRDLKFSA